MKSVAKGENFDKSVESEYFLMHESNNFSNITYKSNRE